MRESRLFFLALIFVNLCVFTTANALWAQPPLPGHGDSGDAAIGGLSQFEVVINEANPVVGQSFVIIINALDMLGDPVETFDGQVLISTNNVFGAGVVTTTGPFFEGSRPHTISLEQSTLTTITVVNAAEGQNQAGSSEPFLPAPAGVSGFIVGECPAGPASRGVSVNNIGTQQLGVPFSLCVSALDQFGNHATSFEGSVFLEAVNNTFEAGVNQLTGNFSAGSIEWPVLLTELSENTSIRVENATGPEEGESNVFKVIEGLPEMIHVEPQPPTFVLAGEPIFPAPSVTIKDGFGNTLEDVPVQVELLKNMSDFSFAAGSVTQVVTSETGLAEFSNLRISQVGNNYQIRFSVGEDLEKLSDYFVTVLPGSPTAMLLKQQPLQSESGQSIGGPPRIKLIDAQGNGVPGYAIVAAIDAGNLSGNKINVTDGEGFAEFDDLVITESGTYSLTFSSSVSGVSDVISNGFEVTGSSVDYFAITALDGSMISEQTAGTGFQIIITAFDMYDNIASFHGTVNLTSSNEFADNVNPNTNAFVNGVVTHTLSLCVATASSTITAKNNQPGENQQGVSNAFLVQHGSLHDFFIGSADQDDIPPQVAGEEFLVRITARDVCGNRVSDFSSSVSLDANKDFGLGVATETMSFSGGLLDMHSLNIREAAPNVIITAMHGSQSGTSNPFHVTPREINITVDNSTIIYGDADIPFCFQDFSAQLMPGDDLSMITGGDGTADYLDFVSDAPITSAVGIYPQVIGIHTHSFNGPRADSYSYIINYGNLEIKTLSVTVHADAGQKKVYGENDPPYFSFVSDPAVGFELPNGVPISFAGKLDRDPGELVGTYSITLGNLDNENYQIAYKPADFRITRRPITISADAGQNKVYGEVDPQLDYTVTEGNLVFSDGFIGSLERLPGEDVGSYSIITGTLSIVETNKRINKEENYLITFESNHFTITQREVSVSAHDQLKAFGAPDPPLTFDSEPEAGFELPNGSLLNFTGSLTREEGELPGFYAIEQGSLDNPNYSIHFFGGIFTIGEVVVNVEPALQTICTNTRPLELVSTVEGGTGSHTFTWQARTDLLDWHNVADTENFRPGPLSETTWFRLLANDYLLGTYTSTHAMVIVEEIPEAGILQKEPDMDRVHEGQWVLATILLASGGNGVDAPEYRTHDGVNWSPWMDYVEGQQLSGTDVTGIQIRTRRLADGCQASEYSKPVQWAVGQQAILNESTGIGYFTLQDAVNEAFENDVIIVFEDTGEKEIMIDKQLTIVFHLESK